MVVGVLNIRIRAVDYSIAQEGVLSIAGPASLAERRRGARVG